jgi:hypothetical protein
LRSRFADCREGCCAWDGGSAPVHPRPAKATAIAAAVLAIKARRLNTCGFLIRGAKDVQQRFQRVESILPLVSFLMLEALFRLSEAMSSRRDAVRHSPVPACALFELELQVTLRGISRVDKLLSLVVLSDEPRRGRVSTSYRSPS